MKVLLIQAPSRDLKPVFPIGLSRLATAVQDTHDVRIIDPNVVPDANRHVAEAVQSFAPDVIGISLRNIDSVDAADGAFYYPEFVDVVRLVRRLRPSAAILAGGCGFSLYAEEIMAGNPEIDAGVYLEAEESFPKLLSSLGSPLAVRGVYARENGQVKFSGPAQVVDFANLPPVNYGFVEMAPYARIPMSAGVETKRGCALRCSYCPYPFLNGHAWRLQEPSKVVDEIETLVSKHGVSHFAFVDSVFNVPIEHCMKICREIVARGIKVQWSSWTNERTFTEEYVRLAVQAGCREFPFSTDAYTDETLKRMGKNYTTQDIRRTVEVASKIDGIYLGFGFFLNPPGGTVKSFIETLKFLFWAKRKLGRKMKKVFRINKIRIEPHTEMHRIALEEGLLKPTDSLMRPIFYSQKSTRLLEILFDIVAVPAGVLIRLRNALRRRRRRRRGPMGPRPGFGGTPGMEAPRCG